jgi:hypothetical protein
LGEFTAAPPHSSVSDSQESTFQESTFQESTFQERPAKQPAMTSAWSQISAALPISFVATHPDLSMKENMAKRWTTPRAFAAARN